VKANVKIIIAFLFCGFTQSLYAQEVSVKLSDRQMLIGEQFTWDISVSLPITDSLVWPDIASLLDEKIEVINAGKIDSSFNRQDIRTRALHQKWVLTSFDTGYFAIPSIPFVTNKGTVTSEGLVVRFDDPIMDSTAQLADIYGPIGEPYTITDFMSDYGWYLLIAILVLAALWYVLKNYKSWQKSPEPITAKPKIIEAAHIIALRKLQELETAHAWNSSVKNYYSSLSEIMRGYLEQRYQVLALEQTTHEIMATLSFKLKGNGAEDLEQILQETDMVKFAKFQPDASRHVPILNSCIAFVQQTQEKEITVDGGNNIS
jgi:hypothetical protein